MFTQHHIANRIHHEPRWELDGRSQAIHRLRNACQGPHIRLNSCAIKVPITGFDGEFAAITASLGMIGGLRPPDTTLGQKPGPDGMTSHCISRRPACPHGMGVHITWLWMALDVSRGILPSIRTDEADGHG